jgi:hypothetical protein
MIGGLPIAFGRSPDRRSRQPGWHHLAAVLTRANDGTLFLAAVRWIAWLAWAAFTVPALAEVRAGGRGRPLRGYLAPDRRGYLPLRSSA